MYVDTSSFERFVLYVIVYCFNRSDYDSKPEIYHATENERRGSLYRPKEEQEGEEVGPAEHVVTSQTDSLDSTTLDIQQTSPGGKADSLIAKDETFPELR